MTSRWVAALLAAVAVMPVAASAQERGRGRDRGGDRPERAARAPESRGGFNALAQRARQQWQEQRDERADRPEARQEYRQDRQQLRQARREDRQEFVRERREDRQALRNGTATRDEFRANRRDDRRDFRADRRDLSAGQWESRPRPGGLFDRGDRFANGRWDRNWRSDNRYDWNRYRAGNRYAYHLPRYYAPRGWSYGYRRFDIGFTLSSVLFGSNYWIGDPYSYRLPEVGGAYRWVRYYDDALLVDLDTGEVVDVVHDIFW